MSVDLLCYYIYNITNTNKELTINPIKSTLLLVALLFSAQSFAVANPPLVDGTSSPPDVSVGVFSGIKINNVSTTVKSEFKYMTAAEVGDTANTYTRYPVVVSVRKIDSAVRLQLVTQDFSAIEKDTDWKMNSAALYTKFFTYTSYKGLFP